MKFILDTNVLIDAWKEHYPIRIMPSFWEGLIQSINDGNIIICESIYKELTAGSDDLKDWIVKSIQKDKIESDAEPTVVDAYKKLMNEVCDQKNGYTPAALVTFATHGDSFLIAHALAHGYSLITLEVSKTQQKGKVKIPDACLLVKVKCSKIKDILPMLNL